MQPGTLGCLLFLYLQMFAGMATRPPPSPEQLALPAPPPGMPYTFPPWSLSQATVGYNIKAGVHHLHDALQVNCAYRENTSMHSPGIGALRPCHGAVF